MSAVSHNIDRIATRFDDDNAVADVGLLVGTLSRRLGLERMADEVVGLGFWSRKVIDACIDHDAWFSITVARHP